MGVDLAMVVTASGRGRLGLSVITAAGCKFLAP